MSDIVLIDRLGDINFGLSEDLAPHNKPWIFYEILGIARDASNEEIKRAFRDLSLKNHPDKIASEEASDERQKLLNKIKEVLLDDGGALGEEFGNRRLYDEISQKSEFFGNGHIQRADSRTKTIGEDLCDLLGREKASAKSQHDFMNRHPRIARQMERLKQGEEADHRPDYSQRQSLERAIATAHANELGIDLQEYVNQLKKNKAKLIAFVKDLQLELEHSATRDALGRDTSTDRRGHKLFDIWLDGKRDDIFGHTRVYFESKNRCDGLVDRLDYQCSLASYEETDSTIRLNFDYSSLKTSKLGGLTRLQLTGIRRVHFKANFAEITIYDKHTEGIFQLCHGKVKVCYDERDYAESPVLRIRAQKVDSSNDFVRKGELYIQRRSAKEGWYKNKPKVEIAVVDGSVELIR